MTKKLIFIAILLFGLIPVAASATMTNCYWVLSTLHCDTFSTPEDNLQNEANKWNNMNWNNQIAKPLTPVIPPLPSLPSVTPPTGGGMSSGELQQSLSQGLNNIYDKLNKQAPAPAVQPKLTSPFTNQGLEQLHLGANNAGTIQQIPTPEPPKKSWFMRLVGFLKNLF